MRKKKIKINQNSTLLYFRVADKIVPPDFGGAGLAQEV